MAKDYGFGLSERSPTLGFERRRIMLIRDHPLAVDFAQAGRAKPELELSHTFAFRSLR